MSSQAGVSRHSGSPASGHAPAMRSGPISTAMAVAAALFICCFAWVLGTSPSIAGVPYDCPTGVHKFFGCVQPDKPPPTSCPQLAGDPVDILTGRLTEEVVDWSSGGSQPLELKRSYTSTPLTLDASPYSSLGRGWRSNFDARVRMNAASAIQSDWAHFILPDTMEYNFNKQNGVWKFMAMEWSGSYGPNLSLRATPRNDLDVALTIEGQQFVLRTPNGVKFVFDTANHAPDPQWSPDGYHTQMLSEIRYPGGYTQKISYSGDYPSGVSDNLGRWIIMQFFRATTRSTLLLQVQTSDGSVIKFDYQDRFPNLVSGAPIDFLALSTVTYPDLTRLTDSDNPKISYQYRDEAGKPGLLLTGVTDERGAPLSTWTYDDKGRVLSSEHAGGQDRTQFAYDDANNVVTVTNPLGRSTRYSYRMNAGFVRQLVSIDGITTPGCAASNTRYEYDANGFRSKSVDAEGRVTAWTRDSLGRPLSVTEGVGTPAARATVMTWAPVKPLLLGEQRPGRSTRIGYNDFDQVTERTELDATQTPSTSTGQNRVTRYAYEIVPLSTPPNQSIPDIPLPVLNGNACSGLAPWTVARAHLEVSTASPCSVEDPCFYSPLGPGLQAYQDIAIPSNLFGEVDRGTRAVKASWRRYGSRYSGNARVNLRFFNATGVETDVRSAEWTHFLGWGDESVSGPIPAGTRFIRLELETFGYEQIFDNISLLLSDNGASAANPFFQIGNSTGLSGLSNWTVLSGAWVANPACGDPPCFTLTTLTSGSMYQEVGIPSDRFSEIDAAGRAIGVEWTDYTDSALKFQVEVSFIDGAGKIMSDMSRLTPPLPPGDGWTTRRVVIAIPPKSRRMRLTVIATNQNPGSYGWGGWFGITAQLLSTRAPVNPISLLTSIDGPLPGTSDTVRYGYDATGNLTSVTDELGHVTRVTALDAGGRPLKSVDPNGVVTAMAYDARGRLTSMIVNPGSAQARTLIAYDAAGEVTRVTSPDGSFLQYSWSPARRLTSVVNNAGERIEFGYNANGDIVSRTVKSSSGAIVRQQSALFDELGRLLRSIGAAGQQTQFQYDRTDNLTQVRDPRGGIFAYAYDGLKRLATLTDEAGGRVKLSHDASDGLTAYGDARGITTNYVRNGFGEIIQESGPDVGTTVIVRDERGLATKITDPRGIVTLLSYDAGGRLKTESYPADPSQNVNYSYDDTTNGNKGVGRLTGISDASGSLSRYYDALGRVTAETRVIAGKSYAIAYAYNAAGRITAITYPSGRVVSYSRSALGRVSAIATTASASAPVQSVASGIGWAPMSIRLAALTHGNGLTATRAYDGDGRLAALTLKDGATRLADLSYAYGDGMNLTAVNDNLSAASSVSLAYDAAQRLASARGPWGSLAYTYTPNGDRAREALTPAGSTTTLTTLLGYPANSNRLSKTSVGNLTTRSFTYDAAGNLLTQVMGALRLSFTYNLRNRPVTLTRTGDGTQVSRYVYNALEQMVQRSTNAPGGPAGTVHYIYGLDGSLLAEADGATGKTLRDYIWLPQDDASPAADNDNEEGTSPPPLPLALVTGVNTTAPALLMVHADHLGRPARLTDMTRATVWSAAYDPFGQPWQVTGTVEQNLRFPGQYFLIESGLSYNWHRFYDPATGRYLQPDPLRFVDGPSLYA